ncbi:MAG: ribulose-phosphate 3-epimerase [Euryarchaeota archaeon]|nr:ribulose-phosphate 3-epimerase [Euryarchaeota archaeon]
MIKIAPSILSADFSRLGEEVRRLEEAGADWVHVDVMDGNFVPNITIGPVVISHVRSRCSLPFDVHLMISSPEKFIDAFSQAGADIITVHVESTRELEATLRRIRSLGRKVGLSLNPGTPFSAVEAHMRVIDLLLIMTVQPGFAGQQFMHEVLPKIAEARKFVDDHGLDVDIEVDGGINKATGRLAVKSGATVLAAGSALFNARDLKGEIADWKALR